MSGKAVVTKFEMFGYTRGKRRIPVSSYYSWPKGKPYAEVVSKFKDFNIAFTSTKARVEFSII